LPACSETASATGQSFAQPIERRHEARRGERDAATREAVRIVVEHHPHRRHHVFVVRERLAHAHHHDIGDGRAALVDPRRADAIGQQCAVRVPQLADDLGSREVAIEALLAGRAEGAVERASRLRRDAKRAAVILGDVDHLDGIAGADVEQPLAGAVPRGGVAHDRRAANLDQIGEPFAQRARQVGHRCDVVGEPLMHPMRDLLRAIRLLAKVGEKSRKARGVEIEQVDHGRTQRSKTASAGKK
jgi:hypothetical protein